MKHTNATAQALFMALTLATNVHAQNPAAANNAPRTFQALSGFQTIFVVDTDLKLWKEQSPFGAKRQQVEGHVWTFQALDDNDAFVLGTDGVLWLEQAPFGQTPPKRQIVDARVAAFQALDVQNVLVLGTDGRLWLEYAPFGQAPPPRRDYVDGNVTAFQGLDTQHFLILRSNNEVWLQHGVGSSPGRQKIDENVGNFQGIDAQNLLVLRTDGNLWLEHAPFGTIPPPRTQVDGNVLAFQQVPGSNDIAVLGSDGRLWREQPSFGAIPPARVAVDSNVRTFQALDSNTFCVLGKGGTLWLEQAPFGRTSATAVDTHVLETPLEHTPVPSSFFAIAPWDPAKNFPPLSFGAIGHAQFAWGTVQPNSGNDQNFGPLDAAVQAAVMRGMWDPRTNTVNMAITLGLTPSWAVRDKSSCHLSAGNGGSQCSAAPDNIGDWQYFLTLLTQHYNGVDSNHPHIRYYELWNEANEMGPNAWWNGSNDNTNGTYANCGSDHSFCPMVMLAQAAYPIVHQDPYSLLLTPSVTGPVGTTASNSGVTWMTTYLAAGGSQYADAGAFHGYLARSGNPTSPIVVPYPMPEQDSNAASVTGIQPTLPCMPFDTCYGSIITKATQLRAVFDKYLPGKPMLQTEGSWGNGNVLDADTQVEWLSRYYLLQAGLRGALNLQMSSWFTWGGLNQQSPPTFEWGVIECPGFPQMACVPPATPAGEAYSQVYSWLVGAAMPHPCSSDSAGVWTCTMSRGMGYKAKAVWYTGTKSGVSYAPGDRYTQYRCLSDASCLAGTVFPITGPLGVVAIGPKPILVESHAQVCLLYDPAKPVIAGSTIAISLFPCDRRGADLASPAIGLQATGLSPAGGVNPTGNFQFDPTLGTSGGYIYKLSTNGLAPGKYNLQFTSVTGDAVLDSIAYQAPFQVK